MDKTNLKTSRSLPIKSNLIAAVFILGTSFWQVWEIFTVSAITSEFHSYKLMNFSSHALSFSFSFILASILFIQYIDKREWTALAYFSTLVTTSGIGLFHLTKFVDSSNYFAPSVIQVSIFSFLIYKIILSHFRDAKKLQLSNNELRTLKDALEVTALVSVTDYSGKITYANDEFLKISQYTLDELLNKDHRMLNSREHSKSFFKDMWSTIRRGETWKGEIKNMAKDGSHYWVKSTIYPSKNDAGEIEEFVAIRFDISDKKQKEEEQKLDLMMASIKRDLNDIIQELFMQIDGSSNIEDVYSEVLEIFCQKFDWDYGHVSFKESQKGNLLYPGTVWFSAHPQDQTYLQLKENLEGKTFFIGEGISGIALKDMKPFYYGRSRDARHRETCKDIPNEIQTSMAIPAAINDEVILVFEFYSKENKAEQLQLIDTFHSCIKKISGAIDKKFYEMMGVKKDRRIVSLEKIINSRTSELSETLGLQRAIFENASYMIIATDLNGVITHFNKQAEHALGHTSSEIVGIEKLSKFHYWPEIISVSRNLSTLHDRKITPGVETLICEVKNNHISEKEWTYVTKEGQGFPVLLSITSLKNREDESIGYLAVGRDISELRIRQEELEEAKKEADRVSQVKSEFMANMSHEIRTPMNAILGISSMLSDTLEDEDNVRKIQAIHSSGKSLLSIVNDILDITDIESGKINLVKSSVNLYSLVKDSVELYEYEATEKGLEIYSTIESNVPCYVVSDGPRLSQILNNLICNAVKFTKSGVISVNLSLESVIDNEFNVKFSIEDSGIGISEINLHKIGKIFTQVDSSSTRKSQGAGLGLSVSKSLVELMGGEISVESEVGKGSRFSFSVNVQKGDEKAYEESIEVDALIDKLKNTSINILSVDDNRLNHVVTNGIISKFGLSVDTASNGKEALELLAQKKYDIVFMDCHMPVMDGFCATKEIIEIYGARRPYIIALTASAMKEDIEKCYQVGMDDFLAKPVSLESMTLAFLKIFKQAA
jgi:PAS domain S-box-containing protein